ncbi:hypothetical protein LINGRAHAP2_LOCUS9652 [Linum grandiflorum]
MDFFQLFHQFLEILAEGIYRLFRQEFLRFGIGRWCFIRR